MFDLQTQTYNLPPEFLCSTLVSLTLHRPDTFSIKTPTRFLNGTGTSDTGAKRYWIKGFLHYSGKQHTEVCADTHKWH